MIHDDADVGRVIASDTTAQGTTASTDTTAHRTAASTDPSYPGGPEMIGERRGSVGRSTPASCQWTGCDDAAAALVEETTSDGYAVPPRWLCEVHTRVSLDYAGEGWMVVVGC